MQKLNVLIIFGPTGVGKTEIALLLGQSIPIEIINMDVGQFYTPLSIGTAKPNWQKSTIPHHLFDIFDNPINCTVIEYRKLVFNKITDVMSRGNLAVLVGGSGFYLQSLFFPPHAPVVDHDMTVLYPLKTDLWQELYKIDPKRAQEISPSDTYRITRALNIWHSTYILPSEYVPQYAFPFNFFLLSFMRDRQDLYKRINERVMAMIDAGWIEEARSLLGTNWENFIRHKKFIGYCEIFDFLQNKISYHFMIESIRQKTRHYAKRQCTFWRKLEKDISNVIKSLNNNHGTIESVNLTNITIRLYINELLKRLFKEEGKNI